MNDEPLIDAEPAGSESPGPAPDTHGRTTLNGHRASRGQASRGQARRRADEGVLVTRWGFTWRAVTLRIADALAQRIATPSPRTPSARRHARGRWALGGAAAAAAAYAQARGWL
jgi:hypothetical protein